MTGHGPSIEPGPGGQIGEFLVEAVLQEVGVNWPSQPAAGEAVEPLDFAFSGELPNEDVFLQGLDYSGLGVSHDDHDPEPDAWAFTQEPGPSSRQQPTDVPWELIDLGFSESLPPMDLMEELNRIFFERQQNLIPVIHPPRYLQAFYSAPHMRPPMALQYGIWALASNGHPKYKSYHEVFYRRARKYIDEDEMKGYGEHFITVAHAVTTHLPSPEAAFHAGIETETCSIHDIFKGTRHSSFASAVLVCHLFNRIMKHVQHPKQDDNSDNYEYGQYWERHRDIDNTISNVFMFLPDAARLPGNYRDPTAVNTNLNLHACVICLHHPAIDRIEAHNLPDHIKKLSHDRLSTAAQEIVNIIQSTSHMSTSARSPLAALSLYCAASVYIYFIKENKAPTNVADLDFIISAMEVIGRDHAITRAFLRQVLLDIDHNGIGHMVRTPRLDKMSEVLGAQMSNNIPLLARSGISRHTDVQPPLPGRLPLGKPVGKVIREETSEAGPALGRFTAFPTLLRGYSTEATGNKRKRTSPSTGTDTRSTSGNDEPLWAFDSMQGPIPDAPSTFPSEATVGASAAQQHFPPGASISGNPQTEGLAQMNLPHRTGSPAANANPRPNDDAAPPTAGGGPSPPSLSTSSQQQTSGPGVSINSTIFRHFGPRPYATSGRGAGRTAPAPAAQRDNNPRRRTNLAGWDMASVCMYTQFLHGNNDESGGGGEGSKGNPWSLEADAEAASVDWSLFATDGGIADVGCLGHGSGDRGQR
ncbi:hypothetical protein DL766_004505 [Monosporascus sp. MC13-8B]|uniref:Transcription factor domain-containing protein n=1 Tax=Monosporascus cannonballus TaxID=155416 RepID=A0ABY0H8R3_9PEZI|nr:hypothetical protein DL763_011358 [Monosporascus cannonballus]RYO84541.1 hypothetical protein DL762_005647 [Monosporascus cannonballus]RYP31197.1 hypothetical protein DL766_004505 [Monosporascus sp. MC13-8B]